MEVMSKRLPLDWLFCWMFSGLIDNDTNLRSLERLATKVYPRLGLNMDW